VAEDRKRLQKGCGLGVRDTPKNLCRNISENISNDKVMQLKKRDCCRIQGRREWKTLGYCKLKLTENDVCPSRSGMSKRERETTTNNTQTTTTTTTTSSAPTSTVQALLSDLPDMWQKTGNVSKKVVVSEYATHQRTCVETSARISPTTKSSN